MGKGKVPKHRWESKWENTVVGLWNWGWVRDYTEILPTFLLSFRTQATHRIFFTYSINRCNSYVLGLMMRMPIGIVNLWVLPDEALKHHTLF